MLQSFKYFILALVVIPFVLIALPVYLIVILVKTLYLRAWLWFKYLKNGSRILFIYSNSSTWQTYIEENMLPLLPIHATVLNWSERKRWSSHELALLHHFGGETEFNPSAIIFISFWNVKCIRLFQAFKDYKHGNDQSLKKVEKELSAMIQLLT